MVFAAHLNHLEIYHFMCDDSIVSEAGVRRLQVMHEVGSGNADIDLQASIKSNNVAYYFVAI